MFAFQVRQEMAKRKVRNRIDNCEVCKIEIDNSYGVPRKICKKLECKKERRRRYSESSNGKIRRNHQCHDCCKIVKPIKHFPSRCKSCRDKVLNSKGASKQ